MESKPALGITLVFSPVQREVHEVALELLEPMTVLQALQRSGLLQRFPEIDNQNIIVGVWGRKTTLDKLLRDQDRIEIFRPLRVDPKVARRERFIRQGARVAGLFSKKSTDSK